MSNPTRLVPRPPLAACLSLTALLALVGACERDEPATFLPKSGAWDYNEDNVVSNTCADDYVPDGRSVFVLDYDEGDSFDIELGEDDVTCEIDGTFFYCSDYVVSEELPGFDVTFTWAVTWDGDFLSETEAEGEETTRVTCTGEDCNLVDELPCSRVASFEASAQ